MGHAEGFSLHRAQGIILESKATESEASGIRARYLARSTSKPPAMTGPSCLTPERLPQHEKLR